MIDWITSRLFSNEVVGLVYEHANGAHAITVYGYKIIDKNVVHLLIADSDDGKRQLQFVKTFTKNGVDYIDYDHGPHQIVDAYSFPIQQ
jgi:hypothetical protein